MERDKNMLEEELREKARKIADAIEKKYSVFIQSKPDKTNVHASFIIASILSKKTDNILLKPWGQKPQRHDQEINILIGYTKNELIGVSPPLLYEISPDNILYTPAYTAIIMMEELAVINEEKKYTALSSIYQEANKVTENHPVINDTSAIGSIKLYRKFMSVTGGITKPLAQALYQTLNPYYPSFTGRPLDEIKNKLEELGLDPDKPFSEQDTKGMKILAEKLLEDIRTYDKNAGAKSLVTSILVMKTNKNKEVEMQELAEAIDIILDQNPGLLLNYYSNNKYLELILAERIYSIPYISTLLNKLVNKEFEEKENIILIECEENHLPSLVGDIARKNSIINKKQILVCKNKEEKYTSIYELEKADEATREAVWKKIIEKNPPKLTLDI